MHLRRLIVLITNARNIIGRPRSCNRIALRHRAGFLDQRQKPSVDQKKNQNHVAVLRLPEGVGSIGAKRDLFTMSKYPATDPQGIDMAKLCSLTRRIKLENTGTSPRSPQAIGDRRGSASTKSGQGNHVRLCHSSRALMAFSPPIAPLERFARAWRETPRSGGARRDRTDDILLAKQALSQLSYGPVLETKLMVGPGRLELPTSRLSGVRSNHLSYGPSGLRQKLRCQVRKRTLTRKIRRL